MSRVSKAAIHSAMFSSLEGYVSAVVDPVRELARTMLASMDAKPVFFIEVEGGDWIQAGRIIGSAFDFNNLPDGSNNLYAVPLPAPDNKQTDELVMWVKRLAHSLRNARPDSKLHGAAMDYLSRKGLISVEDVLR